jgi:hypothetical protein
MKTSLTSAIGSNVVAWSGNDTGGLSDDPYSEARNNQNTLEQHACIAVPGFDRKTPGQEAESMSRSAVQEWIRRVRAGHNKKQAPSEAARDALRVRDALRAMEAGSHVIHKEPWELWCSVRIHHHHTTRDWHSSILKGQHKYPKWWDRGTGAKHGW